MEIYFSVAISIAVSFFGIRQLLGNKKEFSHLDDKKSVVPWLMMSFIFSLTCNLICGHSVGLHLPFITSLSLSAMNILSFSFLPYTRVRTMIFILMGLSGLSGLYFLLVNFGILPDMPFKIYVVLSVLVSLSVFLMYVYGIYRRLMDVRYIMRSGSVWTYVTLSVDSIYMILQMFIVVIYLIIIFVMGHQHGLVDAITSLIMSSAFIASGIRISKSSAFVVMIEHERKIVESMKLSRMDELSDNDGLTNMYKNIYERVQDYFAESKPYLNSALTINDVVAVVFTNRLYISKAISMFTGRNFRQFVNYYRVIHAVELYRNNMELKVAELANLSGFNSLVSFGMAFKLFMGEKPGDWCRKEKFKREKQKK